jgi:hypothetical protein
MIEAIESHRVGRILSSEVFSKNRPEPSKRLRLELADVLSYEL